MEARLRSEGSPGYHRSLCEVTGQWNVRESSWQHLNIHFGFVTKSWSHSDTFIGRVSPLRVPPGCSARVHWRHLRKCPCRDPAFCTARSCQHPKIQRFSAVEAVGVWFVYWNSCVRSSKNNEEMMDGGTKPNGRPHAVVLSLHGGRNKWGNGILIKWKNCYGTFFVEHLTFLFEHPENFIYFPL